KRGKLGVEIADVNPANASKFGAANVTGAAITRIVAGSAAELAGLKVNDVVVTLNGTAVRDARDLANRVGLVRAGGDASIVIIRDGEKKTITVKVAEGQA